MYLTDLTDAQKNNIKGTVLMENWRSKYDFFLILDVIVYVDASGCLWGLLPEKISQMAVGLRFSLDNSYLYRQGLSRGFR